MAANLFMQIGNGINKTILRSPFHGIMSRNTMLISFPGCKSGRIITTPVNFVETGNFLIVTSMRNRTWWRNLRGGKFVTLDLRGKKVTAYAEVLEEQSAASSGLKEFLTAAPQLAKYFQVSSDPNGKWDQAQSEQAANSRVVIKIKLPESNLI
jgi:hypothetical protein